MPVVAIVVGYPESGTAALCRTITACAVNTNYLCQDTDIYLDDGYFRRDLDLFIQRHSERDLILFGTFCACPTESPPYFPPCAYQIRLDTTLAQSVYRTITKKHVDLLTLLTHVSDMSEEDADTWLSTHMNPIRRFRTWNLYNDFCHTFQVMNECMAKTHMCQQLKLCEFLRVETSRITYQIDDTIPTTWDLSDEDLDDVQHWITTFRQHHTITEAYAAKILDTLQWCANQGANRVLIQEHGHTLRFRPYHIVTDDEESEYLVRHKMIHRRSHNRHWSNPPDWTSFWNRDLCLILLPMSTNDRNNTVEWRGPIFAQRRTMWDDVVDQARIFEEMIQTRVGKNYDSIIQSTSFCFTCGPKVVVGALLPSSLHPHAVPDRCDCIGNRHDKAFCSQCGESNKRIRYNWDPKLFKSNTQTWDGWRTENHNGELIFVCHWTLGGAMDVKEMHQRVQKFQSQWKLPVFIEAYPCMCMS